MNLEDLMDKYEEYKDSDIELSDFGVRVAATIYELGTKVANAEFSEKSELVRILTGIEKTSVASAENQAVVNTRNQYGLLKKNLEGAYEILNMIKLRVRTLSMERELSKSEK